MTRISTYQRRKDAERIIAEDPWDVAVYRRGTTPDDPEIHFDLVGRIQPAGYRLSTEGTASGQEGERPRGRYPWALLTKWNETRIKRDDEVRATHRQTGLVTVFTVMYSAQYAYKQEAVCDERQP
jgi:hypothetical protein